MHQNTSARANVSASVNRTVLAAELMSGGRAGLLAVRVGCLPLAIIFSITSFDVKW